jgi:hypothetical protein
LVGGIEEGTSDACLADTAVGRAAGQAGGWAGPAAAAGSFHDIAGEAAGAVAVGAAGGAQSDLSVFHLGSESWVISTVEGSLLAIDLHGLDYSGFGGTCSLEGFCEEEVLAFRASVNESAFPLNIGWEGEVPRVGLDEGSVAGEEEGELLRRVCLVDRVVDLPQIEEGLAEVDDNLGWVGYRNRETDVAECGVVVVDEVSVGSGHWRRGIGTQGRADNDHLRQIGRHEHLGRSTESIHRVIETQGWSAGRLVSEGKYPTASCVGGPDYHIAFESTNLCTDRESHWRSEDEGERGGLRVQSVEVSVICRDNCRQVGIDGSDIAGHWRKGPAVRVSDEKLIVDADPQAIVGSSPNSVVADARKAVNKGGDVDAADGLVVLVIEDNSKHAAEEISFLGDLALRIFVQHVPLPGEGLGHEDHMVRSGVIHQSHGDVGVVGYSVDVDPVEPSRKGIGIEVRGFFERDEGRGWGSDDPEIELEAAVVEFLNNIDSC